MAAPPSAYQDRQFLAVIGDEVSSYLSRIMIYEVASLHDIEDSVTGLLLAGIGV